MHIASITGVFFPSGKPSITKMINFAPSLFLFLKAIPFYSDNDILLFYKVSKQQTLTLAISEYLFVFYNILMRLINLWLTGVVTLYSISESLEYDFWYPVRKANTICLGNVPKYSILQKVTRGILLI